LSWKKKENNFSKYDNIEIAGEIMMESLVKNYNHKIEYKLCALFCARYVLSHLTLIMILWDRFCYPYFIYESLKMLS
jgi:hypothetical protein